MHSNRFESSLSEWISIYASCSLARTHFRLRVTRTNCIRIDWNSEENLVQLHSNKLYREIRDVEVRPNFNHNEVERGVDSAAATAAAAATTVATTISGTFWETGYFAWSCQQIYWSFLSKVSFMIRFDHLVSRTFDKRRLLHIRNAPAWIQIRDAIESLE